ncbi:hypothetical protein V7195_22860 [Priestia megaterium]|uniref:hypothetical protein n=1 Tax=Priestia megaterium TaxID=1404 RepID=UPI000C801587|nr:hypothetical protein [Priestia megaterium]
MISIHDFLNQNLKQQWNRTRLKTLVGSPFLQGIGNELGTLVDKQFKLKDLNKGYLQAKNIPGITKDEDIVAAFIFNMSQPLLK